MSTLRRCLDDYIVVPTDQLTNKVLSPLLSLHSSESLLLRTFLIISCVYCLGYFACLDSSKVRSLLTFLPFILIVGAWHCVCLTALGGNGLVFRDEAMQYCISNPLEVSTLRLKWRMSGFDRPQSSKKSPRIVPFEIV